MCGLTGFWELKKRFTSGNEEKVAEKMAEFLHSRGPDGYECWVSKEEGLALAHRRLSIIDLTPTGQQPMTSSSGRYVMIYVGEVYNFQELKKDLIAKGAVFKGTSDTEVMLEAIDQNGLEKAVQKFIGMFAFVLWDKKTKTLSLVRDRIGVKPLYWGFHRGVFFFGSQLKSFRGHPAFNPSLDLNALALYFRYNYVPAPHTIFQDFQKLRPGHILKIDSLGKIDIAPYWELSEVLKTRPTEEESLEDLTRDLEDLLKDAVQKRMISDVPLGCFLSGGTDSSLVTALMQAQSLNPIKTFSIGFTEAAYNEAPYAKKIAEHLGTDHRELYVTPQDCQSVIPTIPDWCDEPFADSSQIPTYLVSKMARQQVTVALSGDGGDELFAGYNRYKVADMIWGKIKKIPTPLRNGLGRSLHAFPPSFWESLNEILFYKNPYSDVGHKIKRSAELLEARGEEDLYLKFVSHWNHPEQLIKGIKSIRDTTLDLYFGKKNLSFVEQMQWADMMTYLPDDILTKVDRASMAVSLEAREPLLDHRLIEFAWQRIPQKYKIHKGDTKWILKKILSSYVPESYFDRPKQGFGIPLGAWLRSDLREWAEDLLAPDLIRRQNILDASSIQESWGNHLSRKENNQYKLWGILMFQAWLEKQGKT
jgi:asparagine synthase (glutamine-hydrolysing)